MSSIPLVSIIVPVYNAGSYLRPCMDTLVNQTLNDIEIVCVLDCPTDGSDKVIEEYAAKDERIVVVKNEKNLHIGESRNAGIRAARGEFIGFSDHDDIHELNMYNILFQATRSNSSIDVVFGSAFRTDINRILLSPCCNNHTHSTVSDYIYNLYSVKYNTLVTTNIYRKKFLTNNHIFFADTTIFRAEDVLFNLLVLLNVEQKNIIGISQPCYYHISTGSNTGFLYEYNKIEKQISFIDYTSTCLKQSPKTSSINKQIAHFLVFRLYTGFRFELKKHGIIKAISILANSFQNDNCREAVINANIRKMPHFPSPKRFFLLCLKLHAKIRRKNDSKT